VFATLAQGIKPNQARIPLCMVCRKIAGEKSQSQRHQFIIDFYDPFTRKPTPSILPTNIDANRIRVAIRARLVKQKLALSTS